MPNDAFDKKSGINMNNEEMKNLECSPEVTTQKLSLIITFFMPCLIYADLESLIKKIGGCANNPDKSSTTKIGEYIPCGYSISTIHAFDDKENKHTLYPWKDYMKKFCTSLREHVTNVINFKRKKMLLLTKKS